MGKPRSNKGAKASTGGKPATAIPAADPSGVPVNHMSLEGIHGSVKVPGHQASNWRQLRAFLGPALLVSVGYMGPPATGGPTSRGARNSNTVCSGSWAWPA